MRKQWTILCLMLASAGSGPVINRASAQPWDATGTSGTESRQTPLPLGPSRAESGSIYFTSEFLFMHGNRNIGHQTIGVRGFVDNDGSVSGTPGQFVGSRRIALDTDSFGRTTWVPGFRAGLGYRMEDGTSISVSYAHLFDAKYNVSAGPVGPDFNPGPNLEDTFLFAPVFNFTPFFAGPTARLNGYDPNPLVNAIVQVGSGFSPYGIWNGATEMVTSYTQRFDNWDITVRMPVLDTDYARTYALAGGRFSWIWERYGWLSIAADGNGQYSSADSAEYSNIISQRMYGPFLGLGNEFYMGNAFALSADVTGSLLYSIAKERAKYERQDGAVANKRARSEYSIVPNVNASVNLWWYPLEGVTIRAGYDIWSYFNTIYMDKPVGFNYGAIDPSYKHRAVRIFHGFHVGVGFSF